MKNLPLLYWMEDIDPALIERADNYRAKHRASYWRVALVVAAALLLLTVMLSAFAAWRVDRYAQNEYPDIYDGTVLHALDLVLTQDENAVSILLNEENRQSLHRLFNALRGVEEQEEETEQEQPEAPASEGLEYRSNGDGTCSVVGFGSCTDSNVNIPAISPDGELVIAIAQGAFENNITIVRLTLPDTIQSIGDSAFAGCSRLVEITLSDGVVTIGDEAFRGCWKMEALHIPKNVRKIGENIVGTCVMLESITVDPENVAYWGQDNCLIETSSGVLIAGCETSVIPQGITSIAPCSFFGMSGLRSVDIPEGVTHIGTKAFAGCSMLREVTFPTTLNTIGEEAFRECTVLRKADFHEGLVEIQPNAFWKCEKLTTVTLPDSLQTLGYGVFMECASLTEIEIPHGISKIEQDMFQGCTSLVRVGISDSVTEIGAYAFYGCQSLAEIKLPDKIECINNNTFYDCDSLTEITIPEGVTKIGASAFYDADGLQAVRLPESLQEMDPYAFALCDSLASIRIPQSVTYIGDCAFKNCFALLDMTVDPQNTVYKSEDNCLIEISKERLMFASVQSSIPQGVKIIGESVFDHSTITRITIPESVTQIEYMAFAYSYNLYFLVLPAGLTSIDRYAFYCCTSVNNVYYTGTEEQWQDIAIYVTGNDNILEAIMHYEHVVQ